MYWKLYTNFQQDHANHSLIDDIPAFDGRPELYFDWILKLQNKTIVTKWNSKEWYSLGKVQGLVVKCLKLLPADASWDGIEAILRQQFSLVPTVTHAATWLMHR